MAEQIAAALTNYDPVRRSTDIPLKEGEGHRYAAAVDWEDREGGPDHRMEHGCTKMWRIPHVPQGRSYV